MAGDAKKKRVAKPRAMANLCISCAGFESWIRRRARGSKSKGSTRDVVANLPDDVLVDILSRLPIKSLCRCKLVSTRWRNLVSHPEHRKKLPQTLAGFILESYVTNPVPELVNHFAYASISVDPFIDPTSLSFLPEYKRILIKDICNGLLLCHCWKTIDPVTMDSVVCNPATEKWVAVPDSGWSSRVRITRLGFDPAVSSHFHVFEFVPDYIRYTDENILDALDENLGGWIEVVAVYSSKTGVWSLNENHHQPPDIFAAHSESRSVFFNGVLYLTTFNGKVLAIDVEGTILRGIPVPILIDCDYDPVHVYLSQGHLYLASHVLDEEYDGFNDYRLLVWVLEDYNGENWTLKHNVHPLHLFGE